MKEEINRLIQVQKYILIEFMKTNLEIKRGIFCAFRESNRILLAARQYFLLILMENNLEREYVESSKTNVLPPHMHQWSRVTSNATENGTALK